MTKTVDTALGKDFDKIKLQSLHTVIDVEDIYPKEEAQSITKQAVKIKLLPLNQS